MIILASFVAGVALFFLHEYFPYSSLAALSAIFLVFVFSKYGQSKRGLSSTRNRLVFIATILLPLIFGSLGYWRAASSYEPPPDFGVLSGQRISIQGSPSSEAVALQSEPARYLNEIDVSEASAHGRKLNIEKMRLFTEYPLVVGKAYSMTVKIPSDSSFLNPGSRDWILAGYALETGETGPAEGNLFSQARHRINLYLAANFSPDVSSFLMSIITGERGSMSSEMKNAFNVTGLAHILSISGAHFGLLLFILFQFFRLLIKLLPLRMLSRMSLYFSPSQVAAALTFPIITAYLLISTMEFPAVRSFIMITLFLFGLLIHRKGFWLNTLLLAAAIIAMIQPDAVIQLSCQLSFLAVLCIGFYVDLERRRREKKNIEIDPNLSSAKTGQQAPERGFARRTLSAGGQYVFASSMVSISATLGTAPLVAYSFNYFSVISPLSNLIVTPIIGFLILPLALMSSFAYLITGYFPLKSFIDAATTFSLDLVKYMGLWDFAAIPVATFPAILLVIFYAALLGYAALNARIRMSSSLPGGEDGSGDRIDSGRKALLANAAIAIVPFALYAGFTVYKGHGTSVTFLDVGQGDSAVIELSDGKVMVIDTGKSGFQTSNFLRYRGRRKIDVLVLTHGHPDHAGGVRYLQKKYLVSEIWDSGQIDYSEEIRSASARRTIERGDTMKESGYRLTVFHPYKGFYTLRRGNDAENNHSVVMKLEVRALSILFTGDISAEAEEDIAYLGDHLKSVVIKVPHHGSRKSLAEGLLQQVRPAIAVISSGRNNMYGHPHPLTLERLADVHVYRTDRDGAVGITEEPEGGIRVRSWHEMMMKEARTFAEEAKNVKRLFDLW